MSYKPSDSYYKEFTTSSPATGAATNADSLPAATANRNGADDGTFALTVTNLDAGRYKITGTVPAGYARGDVVSVSVAATVSGVAGKAVVDTQVLDSKRVGDLNDLAATAIVSAGAITTSSGAVSSVTTATNLTNLPAVPTDWLSAAGVKADAVTKIQSGLATPTNLTAGTITNVSGNVAGNVLGSVAGSVGSVTGSVNNVTGSVGSVVAAVTVATNNDKAGYSLAVPPPTAAEISTAIWTDALLGGDFATSGSIGALVVANLDAAVSTRSTYAGADTTGTTTLLARVGGSLTIAGGKVAATLAAADVTGDLPSNAVQWGGVAVTGMPLPTGSYTAPDNPDVAALVTSVGTGLGTLVAAVKAKTDNLPASPAAVGSAMVLSGSGLDSIVIETGLNARQTLSLMAAALGGGLSGAGTTTITIEGAGVGTARIVATVDSSGNRSAVTLNPPA